MYEESENQCKKLFHFHNTFKVINKIGIVKIFRITLKYFECEKLFISNVILITFVLLFFHICCRYFTK